MRAAAVPRAWRLTVLSLTLLAVLARLLIIGHSHGGDDLRIYTYFSRLALHGFNPFTPPAHGGAFPPIYSNSPPLEVALFTGLLAIHDSPTTLRVVFALCDGLLLLVVGFAFPRPRRWRLAFILFYGLNPLVLVSFTVFAEDKTLLFLLIALWILALEREREWASWTAATALTVLKFIGAFAVPALALDSWRRRGARALIPISCFVAAVLLSNLPWFPHSLDAFSRRDTLLSINPPIHASPTLLLARIGIYAPIEAKLLTAAGIAAVFVLFAFRRIEVREAVVWSLFAGYIFLPDNAFDRILLMTLPFLLLLDLSMGRWICVWVVSCTAALGVVVAVRGVPHRLSAIAGPLRDVFAHEATVRHVLWVNLLPVLVIAYYLLDRHAGRAPVAAHPAARRATPESSHQDRTTTTRVAEQRVSASAAP